MDEYAGEEEETDYEKKSASVVLPVEVCKCLTSEKSAEKTPIDPRKEQIYTTATRTKEYLEDRQISRLIHFLMTKVLTSNSKDPVGYLENLLNECMLFRSGLGLPPVLYERRHLVAVLKSFDPGNRGWLTPFQIRRLCITLGFPTVNHLKDRTPTGEVLELLVKLQQKDLYLLLSAPHLEPSSSKNSTDGKSEVIMNNTEFI